MMQQLLIHRLDSFIRKYYKNRMLRGAIWLGAVLLITFLLSVLLEFFGQFNSLVRSMIFYAFLIINIPLLLYFVLIPWLKLFKIGSRLSYEQASIMLGRFFPEVEDKILNTLQLEKMLSQQATQDMSLIMGAIQQKTQQLKPIPFLKAISYRANRKYVVFFLIPLVTGLFLLTAFPTVITDPANRLIKHSTDFPKPAPFTVLVLNNKLECLQQEDFQLKVQLKGNQIPEKLFVDYEGMNYLMEQNQEGVYQYTFKKPHHTLDFRFSAEDYTSESYTLHILKKPTILNLNVELQYPPYTHKQSENISNAGDFTIPEGSRVKWSVNTRDVGFIQFKFLGQLQKFTPEADNRFSLSKQIFKSSQYSILCGNDILISPDSLSFHIETLPDQYPEIQVQVMKDSLNMNRCYFKGSVHDDYGFTRINFNYGADNTNRKVLTVPMVFSSNQTDFFYYIDLDKLENLDAKTLDYYFEVWDNDGIHGPKMTKSEVHTLQILTNTEQEKVLQQNTDQAKSEIEKLLNQITDIQKEMNAITQKQIDNNQSEFENKQQVQEIVKKEKQIEQKVKDLQKKIEENQIKESLHRTPDPELVDKQKELQKRFDELFSEEMKNMFKEIEKMLEKLDKKQVNQMMENIKQNNDDLKKQLDRNLELFKKLEIEKNLENQISQLQELEKKETDLSDKTAKSEKENQEKIQKEQDKINQEFKEIKENQNQIEDKNKSLENPTKLPDVEQLSKDINEKLEQSSQQLKDGKSKKASQNQKDAAAKMKEMAKKLKEGMEKEEEDANEEDEQSLRLILKNLLHVSFEQEALMNNLKEIHVSDPKYVEYTQKQYELKDDLDKIKDSIYMLSKRQIKIRAFVNREISDINNQTTEVLTALKQRNVSVSGVKQQKIMTSVNNLALMLAESLDQMKNQNSPTEGSGKPKKSCKKPGSGKPSASTMRKLQDQLNKQLEKLKEEMGKDGKSKKTGQSMSKELVKMAAQQEAIRKQMQQFADEMKKEGTGNNAELNKALRDMEQSEKDMVNRNITPETLKRQKEILTRMLESEKAETKKEMEEKRESNEAKKYIFSNPEDFFKYKFNKTSGKQMYKTVPPQLKPYYKNKANTYFMNN